MKKALCIILVIATVFTFCACGKSSASKKAAEDAVKVAITTEITIRLLAGVSQDDLSLLENQDYAFNTIRIDGSIWKADGTFEITVDGVRAVATFDASGTYDEEAEEAKCDSLSLGTFKEIDR